MVKLIDTFAQLYPLNSLENILPHIEKCGRTCYKSNDKITPDSAALFINGILKSGHESVIEHANLIFTLPVSDKNTAGIFKIKTIKGLNISNTNNVYIISGNMRSFREVARQFNATDFNIFFKTYDNLAIFAVPADGDTLFDDLHFNSVQESNFGDDHCYLTAHFYGDVGVYKDVTRHRLASFSIESTRYCNYAKDKFGAELNMMQPVNLAPNTPEYDIWLKCMTQIESCYLEMGKISGVRADQLRMMLPHSTKADVIMTANITEWKHVFNLRCSPHAHPAVVQAMKGVLSAFYQHRPNDFADLYEKFNK